MENEKEIHRMSVDLITMSDVEEFVNLCKTIPEEVILKGKDENGCDWSLSAKSLLCSLVMNAKFQKNREHNAHEVDWNTIYVECEKDLYPILGKFAKLY